MLRCSAAVIARSAARRGARGSSIRLRRDGPLLCRKTTLCSISSPTAQGAGDVPADGKTRWACTRAGEAAAQAGTRAQRARSASAAMDASSLGGVTGVGKRRGLGSWAGESGLGVDLGQRQRRRRAEDRFREHKDLPHDSSKTTTREKSNWPSGSDLGGDTAIGTTNAASGATGATGTAKPKSEVGTSALVNQAIIRRLSSARRTKNWREALQHLNAIEQEARAKGGHRGHGSEGTSAGTRNRNGKDWSWRVWCAQGSPLENAEKARTIVYNMVMDVLGAKRRWQEAFLLLERMHESGVEVDVFTLNSVLKACASAGQVELLMALLAEMRTPCTPLFEKGRPRKRSLPKPDVISFNIALSACARAGRSSLALSLFDDMVVESRAAAAAAGGGRGGKGKGVVRQRDSAHHREENHLVNSGGGGNEGGVEGGLQKEGRDRGSSLSPSMAMSMSLSSAPAPNLASYNCVLSACVRCEGGAEEGLERALEILGAMESGDGGAPSPNVVTYKALVMLCGRAGRWEEALSWVDVVVRNEKLKPTASLFCEAIVACGRAGQWRRALSLLQDMGSLRLFPDKFCCNAAIRACADAGEVREALRVLDDRLFGANGASGQSYSLILDTLARQGDSELALRLLREVQSGTGRPPNSWHYSSVFLAFLNAGDEPGALEVRSEWRSVQLADVSQRLRGDGGSGGDGDGDGDGASGIPTGGPSRGSGISQALGHLGAGDDGGGGGDNGAWGQAWAERASGFPAAAAGEGGRARVSRGGGLPFTEAGDDDDDDDVLVVTGTPEVLETSWGGDPTVLRPGGASPGENTRPQGVPFPRSSPPLSVSPTSRTLSPQRSTPPPPPPPPGPASVDAPGERFNPPDLLVLAASHADAGMWSECLDVLETAREVSRVARAGVRSKANELLLGGRGDEGDGGAEGEHNKGGPGLASWREVAARNSDAVGRSREAERALRGCYEAAVEALGRAGRFEQALEVLKEGVAESGRHGLRMDPSCFVSALRSCGGVTAVSYLDEGTWSPTADASPSSSVFSTGSGMFATESTSETTDSFPTVGSGLSTGNEGPLSRMPGHEHAGEAENAELANSAPRKLGNKDSLSRSRHVLRQDESSPSYAPRRHDPSTVGAGNGAELQGTNTEINAHRVGGRDCTRGTVSGFVREEGEGEGEGEDTAVTVKSPRRCDAAILLGRMETEAGVTPDVWCVDVTMEAAIRDGNWTLASSLFDEAYGRFEESGGQRRPTASPRDRGPRELRAVAVDRMVPSSLSYHLAMQACASELAEELASRQALRNTPGEGHEQSWHQPATPSAAKSDENSDGGHRPEGGAVEDAEADCPVYPDARFPDRALELVRKLTESGVPLRRETSALAQQVCVRAGRIGAAIEVRQLAETAPRRDEEEFLGHWRLRKKRERTLAKY